MYMYVQQAPHILAPFSCDFEESMCGLTSRENLPLPWERVEQFSIANPRTSPDGNSNQMFYKNISKQKCLFFIF